MTPIASISLAFLCCVIVTILEMAETQSREWHEDRALLRSSGFFIGLAVGFVANALFF